MALIIADRYWEIALVSGVIGIYIIALTLRLGRVPARNLEIIGNLFGIPLMTIELGTTSSVWAMARRGGSPSGRAMSPPGHRKRQAREATLPSVRCCWLPRAAEKPHC